LKQHLESVWRQTGVKPKELDELCELPESCSQVWSWFTDLSSSRSSNGFGINPLAYSEIKAYFDLMQIEPLEWELRLLKRFDLELIKYYAKKAEETSKKS
jgi:hypothetical protein